VDGEAGAPPRRQAGRSLGDVPRSGRERKDELEFIAAVAIGLNPYIGALVLAALVAFTPRGPETAVLAATPQGLLIALTALAGLAAPVDFVLGKFVRFAPRVRRVSQFVAPVAGGVAAAAVSQSELPLPLPLVFVGGALVSWSVAAMISALAARGSRSRAWVGLGHVPVLMAAATAAASIIPLALASTVVGTILALSALGTLVLVSLAPALSGLRAGGERAYSGRGLGARRTENVGVQVNV
jgi:hypothetical protein